MKYLLALFISLLTLIGLKQIAQAETSINVSNNTTGGSNTHVDVNSNVTSTSTSTNSVNSQTHVHIDNNGEVKDFNTTGGNSVNWQSSDGKSSVKINNNSDVTTAPDTSTTITPTDKPEPTDTQDTHTASPSVKPNQKHISQSNHSFFKLFLTWLTSFFK